MGDGTDMAGAHEGMNDKIKCFLDTSRSPIVAWFKSLQIRIKYMKKILPFINNTPRKFMNIFTENIYGILLLRKWASRAGYLLLLSTSLIAIIIADQFEYTRQFIHSANANEAIIGTFTVFLALMIPLAITLIQSDGNVDFVRQAIVRTIIRFGWAAFVLVLICIALFIPSGIYVAGDSLTLKSLYTPVLICCVVFMLLTFYRSIRWLSDEAGHDFSRASGSDESANDLYGFSSYRFAQVMRLLQDANFQTWMAIWSQRFPIGYEDTIHEAFFKRIDDVIDHKKRKQYRSISLELQSYNANFDNRNKLGYKFEYQNPEKFFILFGKVERILKDDYVDSRLDGLWSGKDALKSISTKAIDSLMDNRRIWSLFQAMNKYVTDRDLVRIAGDEVKDDELVRVFLSAVFDAIKSDKVSAHDALSEIKDDSAWAVSYDHLYNNEKRFNLSFLVELIYQKWLNDLLDKKSSKELFMFNDTIVEHIFPGTDSIIMGKLYWLLHLAHSSDYLELWIKESRPIGLMNLSGDFEFVGDKTKEDMWKEYRERMNVQEFNSIKLFCSRYRSYLRTDFMKLAKNLAAARAMSRKDLSETEEARLDDFIRLAELIKQFYDTSDKERESIAKKSKTRSK